MNEQNNHSIFSIPPNKLDVTIYGNTEQITDTLSKSRVRIFYKGMNRNRTFISEDFANQLINSLPYTPIKGIFDSDSLDFKDHGEDNTDGRIYGIVPENPNCTWEDFQDIDGITRTYACCDVYLFTGLYPEAKLVQGKSQSMEIFRKTLVGEWRLNENDKQPYYHFISGSLVGLQTLGDEVEPCFEGAAFFSAIKDLDKLITYVKNFTKKEAEKMSVDKSLFRISDNEKADILFDLLNPNYENGELNYIITQVYDDYAICCSKTGFSRVYYSKEGDNISIGDIIPVKIVDVTESEYIVLETMRSVSGTYEAYSEEYNLMNSKLIEAETNKDTFENTVKELNEKVSALESTIAQFTTTENELNNKINDLTSENERIKAENTEFQSTISDIKNDNEILTEFKNKVEMEQKQSILSKYEEHLSEESMTELQKIIDTYSVNDFKKEVCTAAVENDSTIFLNKNESNLIYTGDSHYKNVGGGALALLNKRKNGGNK